MRDSLRSEMCMLGEWLWCSYLPVFSNDINVYHFWKAHYGMFGYNTGINARKQDNLPELSNPHQVMLWVIPTSSASINPQSWRCWCFKERKEWIPMSCLSSPRSKNGKGHRKKSRRDGFRVKQIVSVKSPLEITPLVGLVQGDTPTGRCPVLKTVDSSDI